MRTSVRTEYRRSPFGAAWWGDCATFQKEQSMFVIIYLVDGVRHEGERFRTQREAEAMLAHYVDPAWVEAVVR